MKSKVEGAFDVPENVDNGDPVERLGVGQKTGEVSDGVKQIGAGTKHCVYEGADSLEIVSFEGVVGFRQVFRSFELEVTSHWRGIGLTVGRAETIKHSEEIRSLSQTNASVSVPRNLEPQNKFGFHQILDSKAS